MKREYTIRDFSLVVDTLKQKVPGITIITDIICGFPTETPDDFQETMELCKKYQFPSLFINQFFPRPGTPAARMKRIPANDVKKRTKELGEYFATYSPYTGRIGKKYQALVTETSHDEQYYVGHNEFYEQILVPKDPELMGKLVQVEIISVCKFSMTGKLLSESPPVRPTEKAPLKFGQVSGVRVVEDQIRSQVLSSKSTSSGFSTWLYHGGAFILLLAIVVRIMQLVLFAQDIKKEGNHSNIG